MRILTLLSCGGVNKTWIKSSPGDGRVGIFWCSSQSEPRRLVRLWFLPPLTNDRGDVSAGQGPPRVAWKPRRSRFGPTVGNLIAVAARHENKSITVNAIRVTALWATTLKRNSCHKTIIGYVLVYPSIKVVHGCAASTLGLHVYVLGVR